MHTYRGQSDRPILIITALVCGSPADDTSGAPSILQSHHPRPSLLLPPQHRLSSSSSISVLPGRRAIVSLPVAAGRPCEQSPGPTRALECARARTHVHMRTDAPGEKASCAPSPERTDRRTDGESRRDRESGAANRGSLCFAVHLFLFVLKDTLLALVIPSLARGLLLLLLLLQRLKASEEERQYGAFLLTAARLPD